MTFDDLAALGFGEELVIRQPGQVVTQIQFQGFMVHGYDIDTGTPTVLIEDQNGTAYRCLLSDVERA